MKWCRSRSFMNLNFPKCAVVVLGLVSAFLLAPLSMQAGNFYAGTTPATVPWANGIVPYEFTNTLTAAQQQTYLDGLREWELAANVKFIPHTTETRWILFTYNTNGFDNVSAGYTPQVVSVASLSRAQVCHEMGHSFGFTHENIRPDATNFIVVVTNNIAHEPANIQWFVSDLTSVTNGNYDFESVMHLGWDFDSVQPGVLPTQQPKPPDFPRHQFRMGNYCLSPGDRAALAYLYGLPVVPLTNVVTTAADHGPGSLRAAIYYATDHPGSTVRFDIPTSDPGFSNGVFNIHLTGMLPPLAANGMVLDGSTQPGFADKPLIVVDASQIITETFTSDTFLIYSSSNQIKNISFSGFDWNGVTLLYADATNNTISGCWIGLDATGTNAAPNAYQGISIASGASRNVIGGPDPLARNVISGNSAYGIYLADSNTTGNMVLGNFIGTDASGLNAVPNGKSGVFIGNSSAGNFIGGLSAPARNVISGNTEYGIFLADTRSNSISGNYIGLDAGGLTALGNVLAGVIFSSRAQNNLLGRIGAGAGNVISGNAEYGVIMAGASSNTIAGNYIGPDSTGQGAPANSNPYGGIGIWGGAANNLIGGTVPGARNLISGNQSYGIFLEDPGTSGNLIQANLIGTDATGTNALGNWFAGVALWNGATSNAIGGPDVNAGNTIAFNQWAGVDIYDAATTNNSIRGNSIFNNGGLGIDLVVDGESFPGITTNDLGDADTGPNDLQNFPVIISAVAGGGTIVQASLNSLPDRDFFVDFYASPDADYGGYGEGKFYLGGVTVTTDGSGNVEFAFTNLFFDVAGQYITATATDAQSGDTSEFSQAFLAVSAPAAPFFAAPLSLTKTGFVATAALAIGQSYHIQATTNFQVWVDLTNFTASATNFLFLDPAATNHPYGFYRIKSP